MQKRMLPGVLTALVLSGAVAAAQQGSAYPAPSADQKTAATITVSGCVQPEASVLKRNPAAGDAGMSDEFVLTKSALGQPGAKTSTAESAAESVATSGSLNPGKVYRVTGDKEADLKSYVGKRVEITGTFKQDADEKAELAAVGTGGRPVTGDLTPANTPEITVSSIRALTGSCQ
jgi:hypothetical protein